MERTVVPKLIKGLNKTTARILSPHKWNKEIGTQARDLKHSVNHKYSIILTLAK